MAKKAEDIAALIDALEQSDKPAIRAAVDALIEIIPGSPELTTILNRLIDDPARKNRWPIAYVLAHLPDPPKSVLEVLFDTLDTQDPDIRWAVELLVVRLAKHNEAIVAYLRELLEQGTATQRRMAIYCLRDLNLEDNASLQALLTALRDSDPVVRVAATTSLARRGELDAAGKDSLLRIFTRDPEPKVRYAAAVTLAQLGSPAEEFTAALNEAAKSNDLQLKKAAATALALMQKKRSAPSDD